MELPSNVYQRLTLLVGGQYVEVETGKDIPGLPGDPVWAIFFDSATVETDTEDETNEEGDKVGSNSFETHTPGKYLIYTQAVPLALRSAEATKNVLVHEVSTDCVVFATRSSAVKEVIEELSGLLGGDATMQEFIKDEQRQRPQPQQTSAAG